jgi:uncharacterized protein YcfJ
MYTKLKTAMAATALVVAGQAAAQVTFYENDNYQGRSFTTQQPVGDFERFGFNERASSVLVLGERWEACEDVRYGGRCVVLRPGQYGSLNAMGLSGRVTSVRAIEAGQRVPDNRFAPLPMPTQVIFYERANFEGRSLTVVDPLEDFGRSGFNDRASSAMVIGDAWELCEDQRFNGRCVVLRPGRYANLAAMGMGDRLSSARAANRLARVEEPRYVPAPVQLPLPLPLPVAAQVIFYERENFEGRSLTADAQIDNLRSSGFNDSASSAVVLGERWEVCSDAGFRGNCVVLRPGRYPSLAAMGLNNSASSLRTVQRDARVDDSRYAPAPATVYDNRPRRGERLYEVNITSVRAVLAQSGQRCWVEREPVAQVRNSPNVGGALVGAVIGGILGHQVGGGFGKDVATAGGALAGGVIGSNVGRDGSVQTGQTQDVQRCANTGAQATPAYWDVVYSFQGQEHRVQMATQPGPTIIVNDRGEPRA